ncbi:MAG: Methyltransferase domain protein [Candidatus Roizmanbacteria bacterium GW2011_GWC2_35_12]|uniref:Methyltransferase domain protein n=1 Tax=Candidatus Roizmanbacteria bacterium GW2011_GWC2_35_12 TaxID=1618485 RepID=A0A0G0EF53_9BACT|nr:MAG: Methyltransferase domain protein [Candidatus Roizmanbacteria bacterium GW2011_GWC2_35_12]
MTVFRPIKIRAKRLYQSLTSPFLIKKYLHNTSKKNRKLILGGHWTKNEDWLILDQSHQDITKKLKFPSSSINTIFLEHVFEHIDLDKAIYFLKEAKRILQKGGHLRIISPSIERIIRTDLNKSNRNNKTYINNILINLHFKRTDALLKSIGLKGVKEDVNTFFLNSIFRENEHKFICSARLLKKILLALGFKKVEIFPPGQGFIKEHCLERYQRGIYLGSDFKKDRKKKIFDIESLAVDAIK